MGNLFQAMNTKRAGYYTFGVARRYIDFATQNNLFVNGHVLVWHGLIDGPEAPGRVKDWRMGRVEWQDWLENYVETGVTDLTRYSVQQHGRNVLKRWDVASEAFVHAQVDGDQTGDGFNEPMVGGTRSGLEAFEPNTFVFPSSGLARQLNTSERNSETSLESQSCFNLTKIVSWTTPRAD